MEEMNWIRKKRKEKDIKKIAERMKKQTKILYQI